MRFREKGGGKKERTSDCLCAAATTAAAENPKSLTCLSSLSSQKKTPSLPLPLLNGRLSSQPAEPADPEAAWAKARALQSEGTPVSVVVTAVNKGGVVVALPVGGGEEGRRRRRRRGREQRRPQPPPPPPSAASSRPPSSTLPASPPAGHPAARSLVGTAIDAKVVQVDAAGRQAHPVRARCVPGLAGGRDRRR